MENDLQKSHLERIAKLENIVNEMIHEPKGLHMEHLFSKGDVYHHDSQEIRILEYNTHHAYSFPKRLKAQLELIYIWYKDLMK